MNQRRGETRGALLYEEIRDIRPIFGKIGFDIKIQKRGILSQIQGMVGVTGFEQRAGSEPAGACSFSVGYEIPHAVGQIVPLFNDIAPGSPHGRSGGKREQISESLAVFLVEQRIESLFHIVRPGGPLGIDVEHEKAVIPVGMSNALHRFQGGVQSFRRRGGRVDADADEGVLSPGAQNITVLRVCIGHIQPFFNVILPGGAQGIFQSRGKQLQRQGVSAGEGDMHGRTSVNVFPQCITDAKKRQSGLFMTVTLWYDKQEYQ